MKIVTKKEELKRIPIDLKHAYYLDESLTSTWPIRDNGEPCVNVVELAEKYGVALVAEAGMLLREECAERLLEVATTIYMESAGNITVKMTDALRTLEVQRKYFDQVKNDFIAREGLSGTALWKRVTQFVADPDLCPPHSTGGAVDCMLVDKDGNELPMGTAVDSVDDKARTYNPDVSESEKENRMKLYKAMTDAGFVNLATEWWHYSYGDQYWAVYNNVPRAIYDKIESSFS
jgi:zinc D-Ala-D-Ala dipeptidase